MRDATLSRVLWKEYRLQRDFWLVIAALIVVLQLSVLVGAAFSDQSNRGVQPYVLFTIGLGVPAVFALGSGAILFAGEREAETFDFQRALPVSAGRFVAGKMVTGLSGALLLLLFGALTAWLLSVLVPASNSTAPTVLTGGLLWAGSILAIVEVFAWATLFSLLLKRVLWATVLGAAAAAFFGVFAARQLAASILYLWSNTVQPDYFVESMPLRAVGALALLAVDVALARRWLGPDRARRFPALVVSTESADAEKSLGWPMRSTMFLHLIWQAWRLMWVNFLFILGSMVLVAVWAYFAVVVPSERELISRPWIVLSPAVAVLIGSTVFWSDQQRAMYQYFAERGVSPRLAWLSRQFLGVAALAVWLVSASTVFVFDIVMLGVRWDTDVSASHHWARQQVDLSAFFWTCIGLSLLCYCTAQACSLIAHSGVIGLFFGIICSWLVGMWAVAMNELHVPLWFSVAPLPVVFLWASWLRAPDWIDYRTTWRARGKLIASIAIPLLMIGIVVACYRVFEIPKVTVELPLVEYRKPPSKAALETARMYEEAWKNIANLPLEVWSGTADEDAGEKSEASDALDSAARQFVHASRRTECWFPTSLELNTNAVVDFAAERENSLKLLTREFAPQLAASVLKSSNELQSAEAWQRFEAVLRFAACLRQRGDWYQQKAANEVEAKAFEAIVEWAAQPDNSPAQVLSALRMLETKYLGPLPSPPPDLLNRYMYAQGLLNSEPGYWPRGWRTVRVLATLMPWEHARARRIVDLQFHVEQRYYAEVRQRLADGQAVPALGIAKPVELSRRSSRRIEADFVERIIAMVTPGVLGSEEGLTVERETRCRALRLQLALLAYRAEHGELPENLNQLMPDQLPRMPVDVYCGGQFIYRPKGLPYPAAKEPRSDGLTNLSVEADDALTPGTPFICSTGPYLVRVAGVGNVSDEPGAQDLAFQLAPDKPISRLRSEKELWHAAWCFPIPSQGSEK